jgi:hypothetical protein
MSKLVLAVGAMASAILLSCTTVVLMARQGVAQTTAQTVTLVGAGDIAECSPDNNAEATAALLDNIPGTVLALGDNAYPPTAPQSSTPTVTITTDSPMVASSMPTAPTGGVSTKLALCLFKATMSTTLPQ